MIIREIVLMPEAAQRVLERYARHAEGAFACMIAYRNAEGEITYAHDHNAARVKTQLIDGDVAESDVLACAFGPDDSLFYNAARRALGAICEPELPDTFQMLVERVRNMQSRSAELGYGFLGCVVFQDEDDVYHVRARVHLAGQTADEEDLVWTLLQRRLQEERLQARGETFGQAGERMVP